ncbi:MAG: tetratricopeptide repeat protein [Chloroflexi bacterium]|nr:tetratricopeptide repeat protein [Chloroflexota bacterium]
MTESVFVARERELTHLEQFLDRALAGRGQVCFVVGEAGSGKTTLVAEFARRAQAQRGDLVVAVGQGDAQTGISDSYLPFREVLAQLTGDVDAQLARGAITPENASRLRQLLGLSGQALVELGPDLIGIFVPGAGLVMRAGTFAAEKAGWLNKLEQLVKRPRGEAIPDTAIEQDQILEQYTNVLLALAARQPLVLVLDDLQWADAASIGLLFRLGRRIGESRVLIVGTYRPAEVALGRAGERHPLEKVLAEFKRYFGDIQVDLAAGGRHFVDAFLDSEPNSLDEGFRQALTRHTNGHPLFTVELLRDMQERGDLIRDEAGRWAPGPALDWDTLPARVEGVIEERIGRLTSELREALTVGCVEGEDFTAEVVARVQATDARDIVRRLSGELEKQHHLVIAQGVRRLGPGRRLSLYRFQHHLFQQYMYDNLAEAERAYLHEDVGLVLEELYGDQADEVCVQLARHFVEADIPDKAVAYLRRAGEQAAARFAHDEALAYLGQALDLTPESEAARYAILLARERVYDVRGERAAQRQDLTDLASLAELLNGDAQPSRRAEVALCQANLAEVTGDYPQALVSARAAIDAAQANQDVAREAAGYLYWGRALWRQGDFEAARAQLERALTLARGAGLRQAEATSLRNLGIVCGQQGDLAGATSYFEQALPIYRAIDDRRGESAVVNTLGVVSAMQGDHAAARGHFEEALRLYRETGDRWGEGAVLTNLGEVSSAGGDYARASVYFQQALDICRAINDRQGEGAILNNLGEVLAKRGDYGRARSTLEEALGTLSEIGDRPVEGVALGNLGLVHLCLGDHAGAGEYLARALIVLRDIGDRPGEALVLAHRSLLAHRQGDDEVALEHSQQALSIAQDLGDRATQAVALTNQGHALAHRERFAEAADAYQQARALWRELGHPRQGIALEPLAGLARVSLAQGDPAGATDHVTEILDHLDRQSNPLDGTVEPLRVYRTCCQVLRANRDPRAREVLAAANALLQERAAGIDDETLRRSFLDLYHEIGRDAHE